MVAGSVVREFHPTPLSVAFKLRLHYPHLPQAIQHLRILGNRFSLCDGRIEPPEDLLERVVVSLGVASRQIGVRSSCLLQQ